LISLSLSGFNPPPTSERLNGDLFYIHAHTLEDQDLHISACPSGFYINQSKISSFNPHKSTVYKQTYGSLIDLFKNVSEKFRQNLELFLNETKLTEAMKYKFYSFERIRKDHWLESP
jgi:protein TIF31